MSNLSVESTARDQADAVRRREISARELLDLHLARIAERNPELNAIVSLDEERARAGAAAADEALASGAEVGAAARAAVRVQGHPRRRGLAHDVRLAALRRPRRRARRPHRRAGTPRRRRRHRQDQRAGVRRRLAHLQPGLRPDPQPGRPVALRRRLVGRRRRARSRPGWCRSPTAPTWAARCATRRRSAASSGCGRRWAGCRSGRSTTSGRPPPSAARWPATSATSPCCSR